MKKIILLIFCSTLLSNCAQYNSLLGPGITLATTGNVARAGGSLAASYTIDQVELVENTEIRKCKIYHSAELNEIFFTTLDELGCEAEDVSILK